MKFLFYFYQFWKPKCKIYFHQRSIWTKMVDGYMLIGWKKLGEYVNRYCSITVADLGDYSISTGPCIFNFIDEKILKIMIFEKMVPLGRSLAKKG